MTSSGPADRLEVAYVLPVLNEGARRSQPCRRTDQGPVIHRMTCGEEPIRTVTTVSPASM
jgi:hypothetical protein